MNKTYFKRENSISILGCGWLGLPLARYLLKKSMAIKGSTTNSKKLNELKRFGIEPYQISFDPNINKNFNQEFFHSDILIVNFPPQRRQDIESFHPLQFKSLLSQIRKSTIRKVIFISSTSVYANTNGLVYESNKINPEKGSGKALRLVESMLLQEKGFKTSIIRFGGLIGYDRKPGRFFTGKKDLKNGEAPVNLIHLDDCIGVISHIIENELWGEIYNACCPEHPNRKDFYEAAAKIHHFQIPEFNSGKSNYKIISSKKLIEETHYNFQFESPIDALKF
ncbi:SDR family NAD(P)-dependent oxidoreductase [Ancylomarina longa]|uniref:SDR family NAD(P)-dependent oxidoreductase n=1 Tax=Ancylomarina longa TaxID=2487017 RepID=A0A434AZA0_9BACT|nr:SDR family NAD(P)-dependent oxidoreductase [Ancylomarina longa]RUT79864.1 SDR family NAD(P)-dependent oxidoreductase [Ancylomarina longa]